LKREGSVTRSVSLLLVGLGEIVPPKLS